MEAVRAAIEKQVLSLTGLALGGVDFENPPGDPGLFGPQSVIWQVHRDFTPMLCGGVSALLLQMLHPLALAGVWDHSNFRALCRQRSGAAHLGARGGEQPFSGQPPALP